MGFSRQEYWSGLPCPPPGDLLDPGIEPRSSTLQADSLPAEPQGKPKNTGVPIPSPEDLTDPGIKLGSPALQVDFLPAELPGKPKCNLKCLHKREAEKVKIGIEEKPVQES